MRKTHDTHFVLFCITTLVVVLISSCAKESEPTFSSLWDNKFSGCGVSCHSSSSQDGTADGPHLSTKSEFYNNLVNKNVSTHYPQWLKTGDCDNLNLISPYDASQSTLAAAMILSVSDGLKDVCSTTYGFHSTNNAVITDSEVADSLIEWINDGAKNN